MSRLLLPIAFCLAALLAGNAAHGADEESAEALPPNSVYVELGPSMVANYGAEGRLRYVRLDVSLRVLDSSADAVRRHLPWLRHSLLMLISSQSDEAINSMPGREQLRSDALTRLRQILKEEEGIDGIEDVLFTSFIVQR